MNYENRHKGDWRQESVSSKSHFDKWAEKTVTEARDRDPNFLKDHEICVHDAGSHKYSTFVRLITASIQDLYEKAGKEVVLLRTLNLKNNEYAAGSSKHGAMQAVADAQGRLWDNIHIAISHMALARNIINSMAIRQEDHHLSSFHGHVNNSQAWRLASSHLDLALLQLKRCAIPFQMEAAFGAALTSIKLAFNILGEIATYSVLREWKTDILKHAEVLEEHIKQHEQLTHGEGSGLEFLNQHQHQLNLFPPAPRHGRTEH